LLKLLTFLRNGYRASLPSVLVNNSIFVRLILDVLQRNMLIVSYSFLGNNNKLRVFLRYFEYKNPFLQLRIFASSSYRVNCTYIKLRRHFLRFPSALTFVSTTKGIFTLREALLLRLGGDLLFEVWF